MNPTSTTLEDLLATPTGRKMLEEHEAASGISEDDRMAAANELAALRAQDPEVAELRDEKREAEERVAEMKEEIATAKADVAATENRLAGIRAQRERRERDLLRILRDSAPPELRGLREWAKDKLEEERGRQVQTKERRLLGGKNQPTHWTKPSHERRLEYLASITACNGLADKAMVIGDVHELRVRLAEIQSGLDEIPIEYTRIRR